MEHSHLSENPCECAVPKEEDTKKRRKRGMNCAVHGEPTRTKKRAKGSFFEQGNDADMAALLTMHNGTNQTPNARVQGIAREAKAPASLAVFLDLEELGMPNSHLFHLVVPVAVVRLMNMDENYVRRRNSGQYLKSVQRLGARTYWDRPTATDAGTPTDARLTVGLCRRQAKHSIPGFRFVVEPLGESAVDRRIALAPGYAYRGIFFSA